VLRGVAPPPVSHTIRVEGIKWIILIIPSLIYSFMVVLLFSLIYYRMGV
jgi:hypothetical protein